MSKVNPELADWIKWLPLNWYQGGRALDGFDWLPFLKLVLASIFQILAAYFLFEQRDIRVAGEGSIDWKRVLNPLLKLCGLNSTRIRELAADEAPSNENTNHQREITKG